MALFLSTYINKVDRKGRVSVPASFRATLSGEAFQGIVLFRSNNHVCLEGFGQSAMEDLSGRLDHFDLFSAEQDDMATAIFGEAVQLPFDGDGRIILPSALISFSGLEEQAAFVGLGRKFQIWNPEEFESRRDKARQSVQEKGLTLPREKAGGAES
ncbi:MAG: division/cell wall cluster transcriptional repressor MraZ [Alphaproteobacteria bacterium CG_4_9_14_3_um_filter_47_13]|nr:MAG: division/cell wall cluster transcriptional repressor MraZ [Alphaproteobacteria bacterium CG_4_9_14_3_um_filter_47_13]